MSQRVRAKAFISKELCPTARIVMVMVRSTDVVEVGDAVVSEAEELVGGQRHKLGDAMSWATP